MFISSCGVDQNNGNHASSLATPDHVNLAKRLLSVFSANPLPSQDDSLLEHLL